MRAFLYTGALLLTYATCAAAQGDPVSSAVHEIERGNLSAAEGTLRSELRAHPENPDALGVLAVVLDQQKKYADADEVYRRAVALSPDSVALLNNYGNHLLAMGKLDRARSAFLKVIAKNPLHPNANFQLARIALNRNSAAEALRYLDRLPAKAQQSRDSEMLRVQALFEMHREREAKEILNRLSAGAGTDAGAHHALGVALAAVGLYEKAEDQFSRAVERAPDNFDTLYHLGLAAAHAGHDDRARDILQAALRKQPQNVDVLYDLAAVNVKLKRSETALQLLADAARLAPGRPDIQQLLARTTADLGYFGDAVAVWNRYLALVPSDDIARRERAFAASAVGEEMVHALADLKAYASRHPNDAVGHYELGLAEASSTPDDALREFDRALALKPGLTAALIARGLVRFKQGNFRAALPDFEASARQEPGNAVVLDRLGQTYVALDRDGDAVPILHKAAELAPRDSKTLLHLGRALTHQGRQDEAMRVFARVRELGPDQSTRPHPAGLFDFLSLSPDDQRAKYRAGVERAVQTDPLNREAQVRYLELLLDEGRTGEAVAVARKIGDLAPSAPLLAQAGNALFSAQQYSAARDLLEKAMAADSSADVVLSLAMATSHVVSPQAGLEHLDRMPHQQRTGDYYLARAQLLAACGRHEEAEISLNRALRANPTRPDLLPFVVTNLIRNRRSGDALALLDRAAAGAPDNSDVLLMRAVALDGMGRTRDAKQALRPIEDRWPGWYKVWLAGAILAAWTGREEQADQLLQTATAVGGTNSKNSFAHVMELSMTPAGRSAVLMEALFP